MPRKLREGQDKNTGHPIRRVRYGVAMSLDGFIAGPNGEADWIIMDPEIDFEAIYSQFDTMLMGRRTFEVMKAAGGRGSTRSWTSPSIPPSSSSTRASGYRR